MQIDHVRMTSKICKQEVSSSFLFFFLKAIQCPWCRWKFIEVRDFIAYVPDKWFDNDAMKWLDNIIPGTHYAYTSVNLPGLIFVPFETFMSEGTKEKETNILKSEAKHYGIFSIFYSAIIQLAGVLTAQKVYTRCHTEWRLCAPFS